MEKQLRRYAVGAVGFAFVVTWATLGATTAVVATVVLVAGANVHRLAPGAARARRPAIAARPLRSERTRDRRLVPDDPSLVFTMQP